MAAQTIQSAQQLLNRHRACGLSALNEVFRSGRPPARPLDGPYRGKLLALSIVPLVTQFAGAMAALYMPWQGKQFDALTHSGDNLMRRDFYWTMHLIWPLYRRYLSAGGDGYRDAFRAFPFMTSPGPGLADLDRQVLRLDYNLPVNPPHSVRRVLDELVQVDERVFLGKAYFQWWSGKWQLCAYFQLTS